MILNNQNTPFKAINWVFSNIAVKSSRPCSSE